MPTKLNTFRRTAVIALIACAGACEKQTPSAPTPPQSPVSPNQAPQIVATITPGLGVDQLTTFTLRIDARDPDGDPFTLTIWGCDYPKDTPLALNGGVAVLTFKTHYRKCGSFVLTATDARGATTRTIALAVSVGLSGPFRLVLGEGFYSSPSFLVNLTQSGTEVRGTIQDRGHPGTIDPHEPGTIDEEGRFRLRFKIQSESEDLIVAGRLIAPRGSLISDNVVGVGQVIGSRYAGRTFQLWHEAQY